MTRRRARGFSLVEVLVALIITSVGLLGIAKLQAVSYASTGISSVRSLAAIEASSMVSAIRANRAYWSTAAMPLTVNVSSAGIVSSSDGVLANPGYDCTFISGTTTDAPCAPNKLAAVDLHNWATSLKGGVIGNSMVQGLPDATAKINCAHAPVPPPEPTGPVTCTVQVYWVDHSVGVDTNSNRAVTDVTGATNGQTEFTLYVVP